jgi:putative Mn2+ efflux pump MntP
MTLSWPTLLLLALSLALDAFAVSIATGLAVAPVTPRHTFRMAFHFGLFQFLMPVLGWFVGNQVADRVQPWDHWVAFGLLSFIGAKMLREARHEKNPISRIDPTRGWSLVLLCVATSIDALAVGLVMALSGVSVWFPGVVIGVVTTTLSSVGIVFGGRLGTRWGQRAEIAGGCVLLAIGAKILLEHLFLG